MEKATLSINLKKTAKSLFRRAQANAARKDYSSAIRDLEEAETLADSEMLPTIKRELTAMKVKDAEYDKQVNKKMQGFLLK